MKSTRAIVAGIATAIVVITSAQAAFGKRSRCKVSNHSGGRFEGACEFEPAGKNESFTIQPLQAKRILGASILSVWIISPGAAEVRGLTAQGINSRWGGATRSTRDPACWRGSDFEICVY